MDNNVQGGPSGKKKRNRKGKGVLHRQHEAFLRRNNAKVQECLDVLLEARFSSQITRKEYEAKVEQLCTGKLDYSDPLYSFDVSVEGDISVVREKTTAHLVVDHEEDEQSRMEAYFRKLDQERDQHVEVKQSDDKGCDFSIHLSPHTSAIEDLCVEVVDVEVYLEEPGDFGHSSPVENAPTMSYPVARAHEVSLMAKIEEGGSDAIKIETPEWVAMNMLDSISLSPTYDLSNDTLGLRIFPPQFTRLSFKNIENRLFRCCGTSPFSLRNRKDSWILLDSYPGSTIDTPLSICFHNYSSGKIHIETACRSDDACGRDLCICCVDSDYHYQLVLNRKRNSPQLIVVRPKEIYLMSPRVNITDVARN